MKPFRWGLNKRRKVLIVLTILLLSCTLLKSPSPLYAFSMNMSASVVVGQPDFVSNSVNQGGSTIANTLSAPRYAMIAEGKLLVMDGGNNRVLVWNKVPTQNNVPADVVIGQPDMNSSSGSTSNVTANNLFPVDSQMVYVNGKLFIVDAGHNRVVVYNSIPTTNGASADYVIGQPNLTSRLVNQGGSVAANTINQGAGIATDGQRLVIADNGNNRVLIFNSIPNTSNASANVVVGQSTFSGSGIGTTANTMSSPRGVAFYNGKLIIGERTNFRITIFNNIPTTNGTSADLVLGQSDFNSSNSSPPSTASTIHPFFISIDNKGRLYSSDRNSSRYLIWNQLPSINNVPADIVIGQPDFTSTTANNGGISSRSTNTAKGIFANDTQMVIADPENNRVLIYNNTINFPRLGLTSIGSSPDPLTQGRLRVTGNMYVDGGLYNLWKVETSVNGGDYANVASLPHSIQINSTHDPGKTDTVYSSFFSDFEPWNLNNQSEGNGTRSQWLSDFNSMLRDQGYLLKLKATNNNADSGFPLVYFLPFSITSPTNSTSNPFSLSIPQYPVSPLSPLTSSTGVLPVLSTNPTITFSVNPRFRQEFKENIDQYQVWYQPLKYDPVTNAVLPPMDTDWSNYIKDIPSDYDLVRDSELNKNQGSYDGTKDTGNGTYLTDTLKITYSNNSSQITVKKLGNQENTIPKEPTLNPGVYRLRISAIDKHGHTEDTENVVVEVK